MMFGVLLSMLLRSFWRVWMRRSVYQEPNVWLMGAFNEIREKVRSLERREDFRFGIIL